MRQIGDPEYVKLLHDLRNNDTSCVEEHYARLLKRVIGSEDADEDARITDFSEVPILVTRNEVRSALNFELTRKTAESSHVRQIVIVAKDTCADLPNMSSGSRRYLLSLIDSDTNGMPGLLSLVPGMPLVIKTNDGGKNGQKLVSLGICNGTRCVLRKVILDPRESDFLMSPGPARSSVYS